MAMTPLQNSLLQLYKSHRGKVSDKWSSYLTEYDRVFKEIRHLPIRLLEIGIQNGGSLEIWQKFFSKAQHIVGCDINLECRRLTFKNPRIKVVVGDANSDEVQAAVLSHSANFDVIIDDGSHRSGDVVRSFARYFPLLADRGIYVVEDIHCSYWKEFEGGLFDPFSSVSFFKRLSDVVSYEHWGNQKASSDVFAGFAKKYNFHIDAVELAHVHSIEFLNSMCIIRKCEPERNSLGPRMIVGSTELITTGHKLNHLALSQTYDQTSNEWSTYDSSPEVIAGRLRESAERESAVLQPLRQPIISQCTARLYLGSQSNSSNSFDEGNSISQLAELSGNVVTLQFEIQARTEPFSRIRLDPVDCPCVLELYSIELYSVTGELIWSAQSPAGWFQKCNEQLLIILGSNGRPWLLSSGNDPNLELILPDAALHRLSREGGRFALTVRGRKVASAVIFESIDFRVLLRQEAEAPQWAGSIMNALATRIDQGNGQLAQLSLGLGVSADREALLLEKISELQAKHDALQLSWIDGQQQETLAQANLREQLRLIHLQLVNNEAEMLVAQAKATDLQSVLTAQEREFEKSLLNREREFGEQRNQSQLALVAAERAFEEQLRLSRLESLASIEAVKAQLGELRSTLITREQEFSDQLLSREQTSSALVKSLMTQLDGSRREALRLTKSISVMQAESAAQLSSTLATMDEFHSTITALDREVAAEIVDMKDEISELKSVLSQMERELAIKSHELVAIKASAIWRVLRPFGLFERTRAWQQQS